jgi:putative transposase
MTIKETLNCVQKENINISALDDLMMKTETRTINKHGITFFDMHYRSEAILGLREMVNIRYSLFDLSKLHVYSTKGEFICIAKRENKVHPMAYHLGTVKDIEDFKQKIQKQKRTKNKVIKEVLTICNSSADFYNLTEAVRPFLTKSKISEKEGKKYLPSSDIKFLEQQIEDEIIEAESTNVIELKQKVKKQTPREEQINKKIFASDYEKYEWLMKNGCTNQEDRNWLAKYIRSDEYNNLYGD